MWFGWSTQVLTLFTVHWVLPQAAPLPSATVVTLTCAVIEADGRTVTLLEPFNVAESIVRVAYAIFGKDNPMINKSKGTINFLK